MANSLFIQRPLLTIPSTTCTGNENLVSTNLKIMSYNVLAQCLVRRDLFPTNGAIMKWKARAPVLQAEIQHYSPDILVMQEVDEPQIKKYWTQMLKDIGLELKFHRHNSKQHGLVIAYRTSIFDKVLSPTLEVYYDNKHSDSSGNDKNETENQLEQNEHYLKELTENHNEDSILGLTDTGNTGFAIALRYRDRPEDGIVIGTTHLYWHPCGSFERARQLGLLARRTTAFAQTNFPNWPVFLAGDFNSSPEDIPYTLLTQNIKTIDEVRSDTIEIFKKSVGYLRIRTGLDSDIPTDETGKLPKDPVPEDILVSHVQELIDFYKPVSDRYNVISAYGKYYKEVDPENSLEKFYGEPNFSNWAVKWKGLLDYIFYFQPKETATGVDSVNIIELLKLPHPKDMGDGLPREGEYPSDHLAIMATIRIDYHK